MGLRSPIYLMTLNNTAGTCKRLYIDLSHWMMLSWHFIRRWVRRRYKCLWRICWQCERADQKAIRPMTNDLSDSTARLNIHGSPQPTETVPFGPPTPSEKLPGIKREPFAGNVEAWSWFWEQFRSSNDDDIWHSTNNKKVFLPENFEGEPKMLVNGIAVTANTYEETKIILLARYGDKNRVIRTPLGIPRRPTSGKICHSRWIEHQFHWVTSSCTSDSGNGGKWWRLR